MFAFPGLLGSVGHQPQLHAPPFNQRLAVRRQLRQVLHRATLRIGASLAGLWPDFTSSLMRGCHMLSQSVERERQKSLNINHNEDRMAEICEVIALGPGRRGNNQPVSVYLASNLWN
jgi:hypothetical protein